MARYRVLDEWPGSVLYVAANGRTYCAAPRGLIPEHPYTIRTLRQPSLDERRTWGPSVQPRMVLDVTEVPDLSLQIEDRTLSVAPWNAYLVLRLSEGSVIVAYRLSPELPRLDKAAAGQVAIASGHDVAGWTSHVVQQQSGERWHFSPPNWQPLPQIDPVLSTIRS